LPKVQISAYGATTLQTDDRRTARAITEHIVVTFGEKSLSAKVYKVDETSQ